MTIPYHLFPRLRTIFFFAILFHCFAPGSVSAYSYSADSTGVFSSTPPGHHGGEASLVLPDVSSVRFAGGIDGYDLLSTGLLGGVFGLVAFSRLRKLPVHQSMREVSDLIYATCKTYLWQQGKFLLVLWTFISAIVVVGIRINTLANSRTAFAALRGKPYPLRNIPLMSGMSIGMLLISVELFLMLVILLFIPAPLAGPCFIGFAIGESLGAAALGIAGGIFTKIADIGSDLMKIVFRIKEDDARNPGVIADCVGDNAMRVLMVVASGLSYGLNAFWARISFGSANEMDFESPLTRLVWITSTVSIALTFLASFVLIPELGVGSLWWKLSAVLSCGTLAGAVIPELVNVFTFYGMRIQS